MKILKSFVGFGLLKGFESCRNFSVNLFFVMIKSKVLTVHCAIISKILHFVFNLYFALIIYPNNAISRFPFASLMELQKA